jgi:hypothetical protein
MKGISFMTNETFLLNWLLNTLYKPLEASEPDKYGIPICIGITLVLIVACIVIHRFEHYEPLTFALGLFAFVGVLLTIITVLDYKMQTDRYEFYLTHQQQYESAYTELQQKNEDMLAKRKEYTIYLDGNTIDYDKVNFYLYNVSIDDDAEIIYLGSK